MVPYFAHGGNDLCQQNNIGIWRSAGITDKNARASNNK